MPQVNISEAARLAGKGRSTLQRHMKEGKLSFAHDASGNPVVDTSELIRVYGAIQGESEPKTQSGLTVEALREQLRLAHEREEWLKRQLEAEQERCREMERRLLPEVNLPRKGFFARMFSRGG